MGLLPSISASGGDPLEATMSSALGIACASTAPAAIAPFREVVKLLPWQRASSPFEEGAVLRSAPTMVACGRIKWARRSPPHGSI